MAKSDDSKIDTIIGTESAVFGDIEVEGSLLVSGRIEGNVRAEEFVRVTDSAVITGNLESESTIIGGRIEGNVLSRKKVQLTKTAVLLGDIQAARLVIEEGAVFSGTSMMPEDQQTESTAEEEGSDESGEISKSEAAE